MVDTLKPDIPPHSKSSPDSFIRWQNITLFSLLIGYAGFYFCRSTLSVAAPLLLLDVERKGLDKETIGFIVSVGSLYSAIGKIFTGALVDLVGGRKLFLLGAAVAVVATVAFGAAAGIATLITAWAVNRLFQSGGWGSMVRISSNWFPSSRHKQILGILSLSFLFGDAIARVFFGQLILEGLGWRAVFFMGAVVLGIVVIIEYFTLHDTPAKVRVVPPPKEPDYPSEASERSEAPENLAALVMPFLKSSPFWLLAFLSFGLTLVREAFTFWTPTYFVEAAGVSAGNAAKYSLVYPLFGGLSVLATGYVTDRFTHGKRGGIMTFGLVALVVVLTTMGLQAPGPITAVPLVLVSLSAFVMIGPYTFLAGIMSANLGGKKSSTARGLIDGAGYFGGIISGYGVGAIAQVYGWNTVFAGLAIVGFLTVVAAVVYWLKYEGKELPSNT